MTFLVLAALMMLAAGLAVGLPLWRGRVAVSAGMEQANRGIHAARLKELQEDLENGRLSPEDQTAARRDLEADLAAVSQQGASRANAPRRIAAAASLMVILAAGAALYWRYGSWRVGSEGVDAVSA